MFGSNRDETCGKGRIKNKLEEKHTNERVTLQEKMQWNKEKKDGLNFCLIWEVRFSSERMKAEEVPSCQEV